MICCKRTSDCIGDEALAKAQQLLTEAPILAHFDPKLLLCLAGDASAYGIGTVICHKYLNSEERPIAYALCTLSSSERNYVQLECEALSLVYGIKNFINFYMEGHSSCVQIKSP